MTVALGPGLRMHRCVYSEWRLTRWGVRRLCAEFESQIALMGWREAHADWRKEGLLWRVGVWLPEREESNGPGE